MQIAVEPRLNSSHISDIEEPHLKREALRVLEEVMVRNQIDSFTIPLLKAITGKNLHPRSAGLSIKQRFDKELVLRAQTEIVLSVLRKDLDEGEKDWALFKSKLESVFGEAEEDNRLLDRKRELRALLEPKNQTKDTVTAYFRKFSLNKLRLDLRSLIDEKRETLDTTSLDQLSRAILDANGKPFSEDLGGVEKSTTVEANGKQDHVGIVNGESLQELGERRGYDQYLGQNSKVNGTEEHQHKVLGTSVVSGKKRRWEHLSVMKKKSRKSHATPIVNPVKTLLRQCVSEPAVVRTSGPQLDCFPLKKEVVESTKQSSLLKRGEEPLSGPRNLGQSSSAVAHGSTGTKFPRRGPRSSRTDRCCISDSETQNGPDRGQRQGIVETEFVKEPIILPRQRKILAVDGRKEASTGSPEVKVHQQGDNERFVTVKNESQTLGSQDIDEVDSGEVGCDGHEEICHVCGKHGKLLWCEGCPMSMHFDCIKVLGLRLPGKNEEWRCPNCLLLKAEQEAAEAEKVAVAAKDKLQFFKMESQKMKISPLRHSRQENGTKQQSSLRSLQSEENVDRVLKPNQESDEESNLEQHSNLTGSAFSEAAYLGSGRCKIPGLRRTPLPWTREEEEVLKKGVYLSRNGAWGGSRWIRILEFGKGVFDPSRTSVDVKDKWRNLVKRANVS